MQVAIDGFLSMPQRKKKTFREAYAELVAKQYLPFSMIEEKVLRDCFITFHNEWVKNSEQPHFVSDKTVADDIAAMSNTYIAEMKTRFCLSSFLFVWMCGLAQTKCHF